MATINLGRSVIVWAGKDLTLIAKTIADAAQITGVDESEIQARINDGGAFMWGSMKCFADEPFAKLPGLWKLGNRYERRGGLRRWTIVGLHFLGDVESYYCKPQATDTEYPKLFLASEGAVRK